MPRRKQFTPRKRKPTTYFKRKVKRTKFSPKKKFVSKTKKLFPSQKPSKTGTTHYTLTSRYGAGRKIPFWEKNLKKAERPWQLLISNGFQMVSAVGLQAVIQTTDPTGVSASTGQFCNWWSPFDLITLESANGGNGTQYARAIAETCTVHLMATNQSNATQFLSVYELMSRRDINKTYANDLDPYQAWNNDPQSSLAPNKLGSTPFTSTNFCSTYKITKVTKYILATGETLEHIVSDKPMKVINFAQIFQAQGAGVTNNQGTVRGFTRWLLIIQHGAPANDSVDKDQVSTSLGHVDYVFTKKYEAVPILESSTAYNAAVFLPTAFVTNDDVRNPADGLVEIEADA